MLSAWCMCEMVDMVGAELGFLEECRTQVRRKRDLLLMEKHVPVVCFMVLIWSSTLEDAYSIAEHTQCKSSTPEWVHL